MSDSIRVHGRDGCVWNPKQMSERDVRVTHWPAEEGGGMVIRLDDPTNPEAWMAIHLSQDALVPPDAEIDEPLGLLEPAEFAYQDGIAIPLADEA